MIELTETLKTSRYMKVEPVGMWIFALAMSQSHMISHIRVENGSLRVGIA